MKVDTAAGDISVIIPAYEPGPDIERTIAAVRAQTMWDHVREVLVVDSSRNESPDGASSRIQGGKVRVVRTGRRMMPAAARNMGASIAKGSILVFFDSDVIPACEWMEMILAAHGAGYPAGGGSIEMDEGQYADPVARAQYYWQLSEYIPAGRVIKPAGALSGCNIFCEKRLFEKAGGFPEVRSSEDVLFTLNLKREADVCFVPAARVVHLFRQDKSAAMANQEQLGRHIIKYRRGHYGSLMYKGIAPVLLFPAIICVKSFRVIGRVFRAGRVNIAGLAGVLPEVALCAFHWSRGFLRGCFEDNKGGGYE